MIGVPVGCLRLFAAAMLAVAAVLPSAYLISAGSRPRSAAAVTTVEERGGIIRVDPLTHQWFILDSAGHRSEGLTGVDCSAATGQITVTFAPLSELITAFVDEDESYTAVYEGGASLGLDRFVITVRRGSTGAVVPCYAAELEVHNSNFWIWVRGRVITPAPAPTIRPTATTPTPTGVAPTTTPPPAPSTISPPVG